MLEEEKVETQETETTQEETTTTETELTDDQADAAFLEGAGDNSEEEPEKATAEEPKPEEKPAEQVKAEPEEKQDTKEPEPETPTLESLQAENERLRKEAKDHQAFARKESEKRSEFEKRLTELETKQPAPDPLADAPEKVKEFLADNPEVKDIVSRMADHTISQRLGGMKPEEVLQQQQTMNESMGQMRFMNTISWGYVDDKGQTVSGHPDAFSIVNSPEFHKFAESQNTDISHITSADAINLITKFKTNKAAAATAEHDAKNGKKARENAQAIAGAAGSMTGTGTHDTGKSPSDANKTEDDWFNEGAKEEQKNLAQ